MQPGGACRSICASPETSRPGYPRVQSTKLIHGGVRFISGALRLQAGARGADRTRDSLYGRNAPSRHLADALRPAAISGGCAPRWLLCVSASSSMITIGGGGTLPHTRGIDLGRDHRHVGGRRLRSATIANAFVIFGIGWVDDARLVYPSSAVDAARTRRHHPYPRPAAARP